MALHMTPEMMEQTYVLLCVTPPFKRWKLPHPDQIVFVVDANPGHQACMESVSGKFTIRINYKRHRSLHALVQSMAHEMCHIRQEHLGEKSHHGAVWNKLADQVCKHHGFDRGQF